MRSFLRFAWPALFFAAALCSASPGQERLSRLFQVSLDMLKEARLPVNKLIEIGYSSKEIVDLSRALRRASEAARRLQEEHPSAVFGMKSEGSLHGRAAFHFISEADLERGSRMHQQAVWKALQGQQGDSLEVRKIFFSKGAPQHAVILFPKGTDWTRTGVVLDPWYRQSWKPARMTYLYSDWLGFTGARRSPRLED
ncbi:MAG: hypothetical protein WCU88_10985 [Elusimicrobiota bacterium]|jgi:hypothetical protein